MLRMIPHTVPAYRTVRISAALTIGPVIYTLKELADDADRKHDCSYCNLFGLYFHG